MKPEEFMKKMDHRLREMQAAKNLVLKVGIPDGAGAYPDGTQIVTVGATHEFGATFTHPGGTPYIIGAGGLAVFVSKSYMGPVAGVTKAHEITIPQRSFLRVPFKTHADKLRDELRKRFAEITQGATARDGLEKVGIVARAISQGAFTTRGYGEWPDITEATKARKGSSQVLIDTGILRGSITYEVSEAGKAAAKAATGGTE